MVSTAWEDLNNRLSKDQNNSVILVNGDEAEVCQYLGGGGSKEVYDVEISGERYALGILKVSDPEKGFQSSYWKIPSEPEFIERARDSDIQTYDIYERANLEIKGQNHPVFLMTRDQDHENPVYDPKNNHKSHSMLNNTATREDILEVIEPLAADIGRMIDKNIPAGLDSFNICEIDDEPRVFYTDPPTEETIITDESAAARNYSSYAVTALLNTAQSEAFSNDSVEELNSRSEFRDSVENYLTQNAI